MVDNIPPSALENTELQKSFKKVSSLLDMILTYGPDSNLELSIWDETKGWSYKDQSSFISTIFVSSTQDKEGRISIFLANCHPARNSKGSARGSVGASYHIKTLKGKGVESKQRN